MLNYCVQLLHRWKYKLTSTDIYYDERVSKKNYNNKTKDFVLDN